MAFRKSLFVVASILILLILTNCAHAQSLIIDSLNKAVKVARASDRPIVMAELARANFEQDLKKSVSICNSAIILAKQQGNTGARAFCYATMGHLLVQQNQEQRGLIYIDSAVSTLDRQTTPTICAFVWFRKGWYDLVAGNNEKAMPSFLKASKLINEVNDHRAINYKVLINHYISSIYAYGSDTLKQRKYALVCLSAARKSVFADDLQTAYMTLAHSFFSSFEKDTRQRTALDSSLFYYRKALNYYSLHKNKILLQSNASATALNIANSYFKYYPIKYRESAVKYINLALKMARTSNGHEVIANGYGILSEYSLREKDYAKAEYYLNSGIRELANLSGGVDITRSRLMLGLANVAESSGDFKKSLAYYKRYVSYHNKVFDVQKLAITQQLEEQYQATSRENELQRLRERDDYNRKLNWLYVVIGSVAIISVGFLLSSYHYKLRASQQEKEVATRKKEEAELLAKFQQADTARLALEKQEADLKAALREEESARLQAQQELLQDRSDWLEKTLLAETLKIEEKNAILEILRRKVNQADSPAIAKQIGRIVNQNLKMDKSMEELQTITDIYPGLFNALQKRADHTLTRLDLKYCSYIVMGLENKEIATRLGVEPKSIRMTKYRLKQKLKLNKDDSLDHYLTNIENKS